MTHSALRRLWPAALLLALTARPVAAEPAPNPSPSPSPCGAYALQVTLAGARGTGTLEVEGGPGEFRVAYAHTVKNVAVRLAGAATWRGNTLTAVFPLAGDMLDRLDLGAGAPGARPATAIFVLDGGGKVAGRVTNPDRVGGWTGAGVHGVKTSAGAGSTPAPAPAPLPGLRIADIPNAFARRYGNLIDTRKDAVLAAAELDAAVARPQPLTTRLLEKAFGEIAVLNLKDGRALAALLRTPGVDAGPEDLTGPKPDYAKLFAGPASEWAVAFGGDDHHARSETAPPDVAQYRGFKTFLERQGFVAQDRRPGVDMSGYAVYAKRLKAPPDDHDHLLTVKLFNSAQFAGAYDEFTQVSAERRGYFSLSHAGRGIGLKIGGAFVRPENLLETPAPALVVAAIACESFNYYADPIVKYLDQKRIPRDKLTYYGTTQETEMAQADGGFAVLKQAFLGTVGRKSARGVLRDARDAYQPIMASYDPAAYEADRDRMVMDSGIRATPILKAWVRGEIVDLGAPAAPPAR